MGPGATGEAELLYWCSAIKGSGRANKIVGAGGAGGDDEAKHANTLVGGHIK